METSPKVLEMPQLVERIAELKRSGRRIVHCHGCFDLLHVGHMRHFKQAKSHGDILVVTVTPDRFVDKGPGRPAFREELRLEAIAALDCVDFVALNGWTTAEPTIRLLKPDFYAKGGEYRGAAENGNTYIKAEQAALAELGGRMIFTEDIVYSSTQLINTYMPVIPRDLQNWLAGFRAVFSAEQTVKAVDSFWDLKVLVLGEAIIDEYHYVRTMGKSMKEPILASRFERAEKHAGGSLAVANHLASFCKEVEVCTFLGDRASQEPFIRESLKGNVTPTFFQKKDSPTIVKRRFVEMELTQKLFEVYEINDAMICGRREDQFCQWLEENLGRFDLVVVADYGHGMMTQRAIDILCDKAPFLVCNAQGNAGNQGHNPISRYRRCDAISVAQHELVCEFRNRHLAPEEMITEICKRMECGVAVLTRGKYGTQMHKPGAGSVTIPAFATKVVDRVGAGDAVLCLVALALRKKLPLELVGFLGNCAGAEAVQIVGNARSIEKVPFCKNLEALLK
ncbi:MAG: Bifunctional protein HldE [Verrucomicrobiota bacterium]|jgi:rfaE bifunctional protein kinase chain/domain/rfaE bifunctional protein nucleotidyltransferase chain/domain